MPGAELRLCPDQGAFIVNLTGAEAEKVRDATQDGAQTLFETSVSCIGGSTCQVGMRDSQGLLASCVAAVRQANIPDGALPQIYVSGCPSSCGTHQTGPIGFRGASRMVDGKPQSAFALFSGGSSRQGEEALGREVGVLLESDIPLFLVSLGRTVAESGLDFAQWLAAHPDGIDAAARPFLG